MSNLYYLGGESITYIYRAPEDPESVIISRHAISDGLLHQPICKIRANLFLVNDEESPICKKTIKLEDLIIRLDNMWQQATNLKDEIHTARISLVH